MSVSLADILAAAERIAPYIHRTPVLTSGALNDMAGAQLFFKCENFQKVGAFKMRGAGNAVFSLTDDEAARGVATHSSGNHAQALALAARLRGVAAYVVMPRTSPVVKVAAVRGYGAEIVFCEPNQAAREQALAEVVARTGAVFIHPYDNDRIIAGQGTAALELLADAPDLDLVITPVGGGGLLSGTSVTCAAQTPPVEVIAAEPAGAADAALSLAKGEVQPSLHPDTVCDGLLTSLSERTFAIIRRNVTVIWTVADVDTIAAMRLVYERLKVVIEPSAAVTLAAVLDRPDEVRGRRIGLIFSGGNVDLDRLPWLESAGP